MVTKNDPKIQELFQKPLPASPVVSVYYANECFVCKASSPLKRCSRCNMISYCKKEHQKEHWSDHKDLCTVIASILKDRNFSHIFEGCRGIDAETWKETKQRFLQVIETRLERQLALYEIQMIVFPRACFVCHDSRQELLKNCPDCPNASFCKEHPRSSLHEKDCSQIKKCHDLDNIYQGRISASSLEAVGKFFIEKTPITKSKLQMLPASMEEYLKYAKVPMKSEMIKLYIAKFLSLPLTTFGVLQKLKLPSVSKLVIHVLNSSEQLEDSKAWEVLFHLMPSLTQLKIMMLEFKENNKRQEKLCEKCRSSKKKLSIQTVTLSYVEYAKTKEFEEPDLALFESVYINEGEFNQRVWKLYLMAWGIVNCPVAMFTNSDENLQRIKKSLEDTFNEVLISYDGKTDFVIPRPERQWQNEGICRENDQMIIFKVIHAKEPLTCNRCGITSRTVDSKNSKCAECESDLLSNDAALFPSKSENQSRNFFYVNSCQVCHFRPEPRSNQTLITCKLCKMIYYCDRDHQKEHWPEHKDLCRVIINMMEEFNSSNIFEKADKSSDLDWLQSKINLLLQAQTKLGRDLRDYEKEMFLFPRACLVCHESKKIEVTCNCGLSVCKAHKDCVQHKESCTTQNFMLLTDLQFLPVKKSPSPVTRAELLVSLTRKHIFSDLSFVTRTSSAMKAPPTMQAFIDHLFRFDCQESWSQRNPNKLSNLRQMLFAEILTSPLTLFYCLKNNYCYFLDSLVIHVIGAIDDEKSEAGYWEVLLHFLPCLKSLKIVFVGPEVSELQPVKVDLCDNCVKQEKSLEVEGFGLRYDEYFESESFVKPDVVAGFNIHIFESDYGITKDTWNETILTLRKVNAPFVITAKTFVKGITDCMKIQAVLEDSSDYEIWNTNYFSGFALMRDFETEGVEHTNQFVAVFYQFGQPDSANVRNPFYNLNRQFEILNLHMISQTDEN